MTTEKRCYPHLRCEECGGTGYVATLVQTRRERALDIGREVIVPCICDGRTTCALCGAEMGALATQVIEQ